MGGVVRDIIDTRVIPHEGTRDFAELMGFIAMTAARVPGIRNTISKFSDDVIKRRLIATFGAARTGRRPATYREPHR